MTMLKGPEGEASRGVDVLKSPEVDLSKHYALLSVYKKDGVVDFARQLQQLGYTIISSGGTGRALKAESVDFIPVEKVTGNPECFSDRMKTISFQIEGGILWDRTNPEHVKEREKNLVPAIDIVANNVYPFAEAIRKPGATLEDAITNIDIGGPTMDVASAKNFKNVLVVADPKDYDRLIQELQKGEVSQEFRQALAAKAFNHIACYYAQVGMYLNREPFPKELAIPLQKDKFALRYGDNPDQQAVSYVNAGIVEETPLDRLNLLSGKELSVTNYTDIDAGLKMIRLFDEPAAVVIKHNNPCGVAVGSSLAEALEHAIEGDSESAFGGVIVLNKPMTFEAAMVVNKFRKEGIDERKGGVDVIAAPSYEDGIVALLYTIRKSTGIFSFGELSRFSPNRMLTRIADKRIIFENENKPGNTFESWQFPTKKQPTIQMLRHLLYGCLMTGRVKSNTMLLMHPKYRAAVGIGGGQPSRVLAFDIAIQRAGKRARGSYLISDGFIPFPDSIQLAKENGIPVIAQPGGSISDKDVIAAADEAGITMVFTGQRLFWH
jgi:phosphoribosylaminoimidazolecarboxamide formyltransferase/IMP cyclohydrolase